MSKFHHAYNGIPTKRSDDDPFLKDGQPDPLDHLAPDTYSGTLKLKIETKTPLITAWRDPDGRLVVPSASGEKKGALTDNDAIIPASSLKGVLSSAYEEVTQSRFRVFDNDERRPQFRYTTDHPQRWRKTGIPQWKAGFLRATTGEAGHEWSIHLQQYALLPDSIDAEVNFTGEPADVDVLLKSLRSHTPHLSQIASFEAFKQQQPNKTKKGLKQGTQQGTAEETELIVSKIKDINICTPKPPNCEIPQLIECTGYVVRLTTVPKSGILTKNDRLIKTKHNEYIFYIDKRPPRPKQIPIDENSPFVATVLEAARIAIPYYRKNKKARHTLIDSTIRHLEKEFGSTQLKRALTPENIYNFLLRKSKEEPGIPVFVRRHSNGEWEIAFSQLSRSIAPGSLSPATIAKHRNISPASSLREASPADRLLGFTSQEADQENTHALKGRLYLSNARLQPQDGQKSLQCAQESSGWVPSILAGPKPWTAQPYLRSAVDGSGIFDTERSECFTDQHSLIRKTYPTHRFFLTQGRQFAFSKRVPPGKLSNSEVLIGSYVNSGAVFESTLRFEGLSAEELSILLWLLDPKQIVPKLQRAADAVGFFHLGFGKPLGLGTVCISAEVLTLVSSKTLAGSYRGLKSVLSIDSNDEQKSLDSEITSVNEALPSTISEQTSLAVRAFVRSAYGWKEDEDEKLERDPVSYTPYTSSGKKSSIIDYFKDYERERIKGETQHFKPRMLTLEEDNDSSNTNPLSGSVTTTPVQQPPRSNAAQSTSSTPKPKGPVPPPGPGRYRVSPH